MRNWLKSSVVVAGLFFGGLGVAFGDDTTTATATVDAKPSTCNSGDNSSVCYYPPQIDSKVLRGALLCGTFRPKDTWMDKVQSVLDSTRVTGSATQTTLGNASGDWMIEGYRKLARFCNTQFWELGEVTTEGVTATDAYDVIKLNLWMCSEYKFCIILTQDKSALNTIVNGGSTAEPNTNLASWSDLESATAGMGVVFQEVTTMVRFANLIVSGDIGKDSESKQIYNKGMQLISTSPLPLYQAANLTAIMPEAGADLLVEMTIMDAQLRVQQWFQLIGKKIRMSKAGKLSAPKEMIESIRRAADYMDRVDQTLFSEFAVKLQIKSSYMTKMVQIFAAIHREAMDGGFDANLLMANNLANGKK